MKDRTKRLISVLCVGAMVASVGIVSMAEGTGLESYQLKASGRIEHDADGSGTAGDSTIDVVYDADDLITIENQVKNGKTAIATEINKYPNGNVQNLDTFANLSTSISNLTVVPDVYYYNKATEGENCERYKYEDGSYYPCDQYGNKTSDTALSGTISVVAKDDTSTPAEGEIQLVKYEATNEANLSAGSAGYVDKSFILGSGADNISYRNIGYTEGYTDGLAANQDNATIVYTYHSHTSKCNCNGYGVLSGYKHTTYDSGTNWILLSCNKCGAQYNYATKNADGSWVSDQWWTLYNMTQSEASKYKCSKKICGKTTKTIESATIAYN